MNMYTCILYMQNINKLHEITNIKFVKVNEIHKICIM